MNQHADEPTPVPRCRRFTLLDAMVFIAAAAIGMSVAARAYAELRRMFGRHPIPSAYRVAHALDVLHLATWPCVAALTVACLALRLATPRPRLQMLASQPGVVACAAAALCIAGAAWGLVGQSFSAKGFVDLTSTCVGIFITGAWIAQWLNGWWKPESGWLDGTGRLLGALLIALPLVLVLSLVI